MKTDLHNQYKDLSTITLLMITMRPESYQDEIVVVVTEILKSRTITQADREDAEKRFHEDAPAIPDETLSADILTVDNRKYQKWVNAILVIVILDYLHLLYINIKQFSYVFSGHDYPYKMVSIGSYLDLLVLPIVFYLFYKRKRWGWITLFGVKFITILPSLLFYFREYWPVESGLSLLSYSLLSIFLNIAISIVLCKKEVSNLFKVNNKTKWVTALSIALVVVLLTLIGINNHASYTQQPSITHNQAAPVDISSDTSTKAQPKLLKVINANNEKPLDTTYMATGFYFLAEKGISMREHQTNDIYTISRKPFASVKNIISTKFEKAQTQDGREYTELCMTFDAKGTKDLAAGTGNHLHPKIAVVIANKLLYVIENETSIKTGVMCILLVGYSEKEMEEMRASVDKKR